MSFEFRKNQKNYFGKKIRRVLILGEKNSFDFEKNRKSFEFGKEIQKSFDFENQ